MSFCSSCTAPLDNPEFKGLSDEYCKYCTDEEGQLKSREVIQKGIADWFMSWQKDTTAEKAMERACYFMKAMPAWADD